MATIRKKMQVLKLKEKDLLKLVGFEKFDARRLKSIEVISINNMLDDMLQPALERKEKYLKTLKK